MSINPDCRVTVYKTFFLPETKDQFDFSLFNYVADAVDTVKAKLCLAEAAREKNVPIISAMGAGNKLNPAAFRVADISETSVCPLARVMRKELRARGIEHLKVVYSTEPPLRPLEKPMDAPGPVRRDIPGSTAFVPAAAGLLLASAVVRDLISLN